ncbi:MAG: hypothetical protein RXR82_06585 [Nitrososphaeria archaeon]
MSDPARVEARALVVKVRRSRGGGYYVRVPADVAGELGLRDGDYALVFLARARWYHLVNWSTARDLLGELPEGARREKRAVEAVREAGAVAAPAPGGGDPKRAGRRHAAAPYILDYDY